MLLQIPQASQEKKPRAPTSQRKQRQASNTKDNDKLPSFKKQVEVSETPSAAKKRLELEEQLNQVSPVEEETPPPEDNMEVDPQGSPSNETGFGPYNLTLADISVIPTGERCRGGGATHCENRKVAGSKCSLGRCKK
jgi:hypothetical protein